MRRPAGIYCSGTVIRDIRKFMHLPDRQLLKRQFNIIVPVPEAVSFRIPVRMEEHSLIAGGSLVMARKIGSFTYIGRKTEIYSTGSIGRYCSFGQEILVGLGPHPTDWLSTSTFFYRKNMWSGSPLVDEFYAANEMNYSAVEKSVTIGHDVWIGSRAVIMAGVSVGHGAVIAAGAIINKDVEPYTIVGGVPGKPIRKRFDEQTVERLLASEWWTVKPDLFKGRDYSNVADMLDEIERIKASEDDWLYRPQSVVVRPG
ncbi:Chloramphenicol acetyltransferase [compost metagenome]|jgi:acetyltransferase-like isoleucine patch superfamily enzyme